MEPPYGSYGYYEYYIARRWAPDYFSTWVENPPVAKASADIADPHKIPLLDVDRDSVIVLLFGRMNPGAEQVSPAERGDEEHL